MTTPVPTMPEPSRRAIYSAYTVGMLANGLTDLLLVAVPLWALSLGASPTEIGIIVGIRHVLPVMFAIHGGVLMDRLGTGQVLGCVAAASVALVPLYPLMPWFPALLALQMLTGLTTNLSWSGAQTLMAQLTKGDATQLGRFTSASRIGTFSAPILVGVMWDWGGAWAAFTFGGVWAAGLGLAVMAAPHLAPARSVANAEASSGAKARAKAAAGHLIPKLSDYLETFSLLAIPAVALAVAVTLIRHTTSAIQSSFYVVYLSDIGLTGTAIGTLIAVVEVSSALGSLASGRAVRLMAPHWLTLALTTLAIALIAITPLLGGIVAVLAVAQGLRGATQGVIQPVLFSSISKAVGPDVQGSAIGLRTTANRIGAITTPMIMGIIADGAGIAASFYYIGAGLIAMLAVLAFIVRRTGAFAS